MKSKQSFAIIGLGRFGMPLAKTLAQAGEIVIGLDKDEELVRELRDYTEFAFVTKSLSKEVLEEVGIKNCDIAIVCIGEKIETSILTTLNLINLGIPKVIAKATNEDQGEVLEKLGATVVYPERDMALRVAKKLLSKNLVDYISIDKEIEIMEISVTKKMSGKSIKELKIREKFGLNVIAIHHQNETTTDIDPNYLLSNDDTIAVIGRSFKVNAFLELYS